MKSLQLLGIVGFAASMTGCVPEWARENETGFLMEITEITTFAGGTSGGTESSNLLSDVLPDFNDDALVSVSFRRKNPTVADISPLEDARLESYQVRYFRTDGHSVEGVDVPHRITGPLNAVRLSTQTSEFAAEAIITIVRHQAKHEPPLVNLVGILPSTTNSLLFPGQGIITTVAEITIYARQLTTGEPLSATGNVQVTFADFANAN